MSVDGRQVRWEQHNQERRRAILDAAIGVIEATPVGHEVNLAAIAERAGVGRTVVYRHFTDRSELDREIRVAILDEVWSQLLPVLSLEGTIPQIIERVVDQYISWASQHPALHRVAATAEADDDNPLEQGLSMIAGRIVELIETATDLLQVHITEEQRATLDPLVHGLVDGVFGAVRRWLSRPVREPNAEVLVQLTTASVWFLLRGHARALGVDLTADQPIEDLLARALQMETP